MQKKNLFRRQLGASNSCLERLGQKARMVAIRRFFETASFFSIGLLPRNEVVKPRMRFRRLLLQGMESLESRQMLTSDWTNVLQPLNVKGDEFQTVTPLDVLMVINEINAPKIRESNSSPLPPIGANGKSPPPYVDVDCDNFVTPLDVLRIINAINSKDFGTSWRFSQTGGGADGGSVTAAGCSPKLQEGTSFITSLISDVEIPSDANLLSFEYSSLSFDTSSQGRAHDAFEAALLDSSGRSLVTTLGAGRDAFFNVSEGLPVANTSNVTLNANKVSLSLADVLPGTKAQLVLRLVNNDGDKMTSVVVPSVRFEHGVPLRPPASSSSASPPLGNSSTIGGSLFGGANGRGGAMSEAIASPGSNVVVGRPVTDGNSNITNSDNASKPPAGPSSGPPMPPLGPSGPQGPLNSRGKEFWVGFPDNLFEGNNRPQKVLYISGDVATTGVVDIPGLIDPATSLPFHRDFIVNPGEVSVVELPSLDVDDSSNDNDTDFDVEAELIARVERRGIHVVTQEPVAVYGLDLAVSTSDAFLALPVNSLGKEYINLGYENTYASISHVEGTQFLVVATEDNTQVTLAPGQYSGATVDSDAKILRPNGTTEFVLGNTAGRDIGPFVTDMAGTGSLVVKPPFDGYGGNYKFELIDVATAAVPANFGEKLTVNFPTGRESKVFSFDVTAGQRLYYDAINPNPTRSASVRMLSPSGEQTELDSQNDKDSFGNAFLAMRLNESGKYYIIIAGEEAAAFDFSFRLLNMDDAPKISLGTDISSVFNPAGRAEVYRLDGQAGQVLYYDGLNQDRNVRFNVYGPGGQQVFTNTASDDLVFTLPETSTYFVVLDSASFTTSSSKFQLIDLKSAPTFPLATSTTVNFSEGRTMAYRFTGSAAQTFNLDTQSTSNPFRTLYSLRDAAGNEVVAIPGYVNTYSVKLLTTGEYYLFVGGVSVGDVGAVTLTASVVADPVVAKSGFNTLQTLSIAPGGSASYQFSAPAGTRFLVDGHDLVSENLDIGINAPDGKRLYTIGELIDITRFGEAFLPQSGTYNLTLRGNTATDAGSYTFRVLDLDTFGTPLQFNSTVNYDLPIGRESTVYTFDATAGDQLSFDGRSGSFSFAIFDPFLQRTFDKGIFGATTDADGIFRILRTGRYYIILHGVQNVATNFSFQIQNLSVAPTLQLGVEATGVLSGNSQFVYRMALTAGQRIRVDSLENDSDEVDLRIVNSGGRVLFDDNFTNNDSGPPGPYPLLIVPEAGNYFVFLRSRQATDADFRFRIDDLATAPQLTFDTDLEVVLNPGRAAQVFRIEATAGETILMDSLNTLQQPTGWEIRGPVNQLLGDQNAQFDFSATILRSGTHYLTLYGRQDSGPATIRFRATRTPGPVVPLTGFNTAVNLDVGLYGTKTYSFSAPTGRLVYLNVLRSQFAIPTQTVTLNQGETYLLRDLADGGFGKGPDLTGSIITSTKPVAVFGGNRATFIPNQFFAADHLVEQLPPTNTWGREFVTMPLSTGSTRGDRFRFLAQADNTELTVNGTVVATLNRGQFHEQALVGPGHIVSSKPILVAQYAHSQNYYRTDPGGNPNFQGDPLMMIVPPFEQFLANYTVSTPVASSILNAQRFDRNFLNIVAPAEAVGLIEVNGAAVAANKFVAIGTSGFFGAQVPIALGTYQLAGPLPFGAFVYGFGSFDSYGYVGGQALSPVATVSSVVLTPATANPQIGNSLNLTARVADVSGTPLQGIRVDFEVAGVNPQQGFGFSDSDGLAQFSYIGARDGRDIVTASVGQLLDDSIIDWRTGAAAPQVFVAAPLNGSSVAAGTTLVATGLAIADFPLATLDLVTVNGVPLTSVDAAGNFFVQLFVGPGENEFEFSAIDSNGNTGSQVIIISGTQRDTSKVDFSKFADVSGSFHQTYARSSFNQSKRSFLAETAIENIGQFPADIPLLVGITNISDPMILVRDADGQTPDGIPYYDFTGLVTGGSLIPRSKTGFLTAEFYNPNKTQFTYDLVFYGKLNEPPQIQSLPPTEADLNREYRYDVVAIDPNDDAITFELAEAPSGMTINSANGQIRWKPTNSDAGLHTVDIRVSDSRLGVSTQRFTLSAQPAPANRTPVFTSFPVSVADVGKSYPYTAQAVDADGDVLGYRLVTAPIGMTMNAASGAIQWSPNPQQLGAQPVVIEVSDSRGGSAEQSFSLLVLSPADNAAPVIVSSPPTAIKLSGLTYQVIALDADNETLTYRLTDAPSGMTISPTGLINWTPTSGQFGPHQVAIEVLDTRGGRDSQSFTLAVFDNQDPVITGQPITTAQVNTAYSYQVKVTDSIDDLLSFKLMDAPVGITINASSGLINWDVTKSAYEQEPVTVGVFDGRGGMATQQFIIVVSGGQSQAFNITPIFVSTPPSVASVGTTLYYHVQARDPDGDSLTFDLPLGPHGMVIDAATGLLGWLPQLNQAGMQQVVIRVNDGKGGIWLQSFQIDVDASNTAPVITTLPITKASVGNPWEYRLHVQDADGDPLMFELVAPVSGMTLTPLSNADANAVLRFTPTVAGSVDVILAANDSRGGRFEQRFAVQVTATTANIAPIIHTVPRLTIPGGQTWVYLVSADDPNGDPVTLSLPTAPAGMTFDAEQRLVSWTPTLSQLGSHAIVLTCTDGRGGSVSQSVTLQVVSNSENATPRIVSPPSAFRATVGEFFRYDLKAADDDNDPMEWTLIEAPHGASLDRRYGTLRWTPTLDQLGLQRFVVSAKDPMGLEVLQSFSLNVSGANLGPSILSRAPSEAVANDRYVYGVRAVDPENDPLVYAITGGPTGMTIDAARGIIRWIPTLGQLGTASATVEVTDSRGNKSTQNFQINVSQVVRNHEPIITSRAIFRARVDALYQYDVNAIDPEGDSIAYSLVSAPVGMQIDPASGLITWTPSVSQAGSHLVQVAAQDSAGGRSIQRFAVLARVNQVPAITSQAVTSVALGEAYQYDLQVTDPEGDALSYSLVTGPTGMTMDGLGRVLWQTAPGVPATNQVALRVTDSYGAVATQLFVLAVTPDTTAPRVELRLSANPVALGQNTVVVVQASDNVGVVDVRLTMNSQPLVLDANHSITLRGDVAGLYALKATARDASGNEGSSSASMRVFDPADTQGPTIRLTSPQPNSTITKLTDIVGSITDDNLQFYRIDVGRADLVDANRPEENDPDYRTLVTSNVNAVDKVLATFDPTTLINDDYVIRIIAKDLSGNVSAKTAPLSLDGQLKLGELKLDFTDLSVAVAGIPITITRSYDSRNANEQGDFGYGWSLSVQDAQIRETIPVNPLEEQGLYFAATPFQEGTKVYLTNPEGRRVGFTFKPQRQFSLFGGGSYSPKFVPDPGVTDQLDVGSVPLRNINGSFFSSFFGDPFNPSAYRLTTRFGVVYEYGQFDGLANVLDRSGNRLDFRSDGIFSSTGPSVQFIRDPQGRIDRIVDPAGNSIVYGYSAAGDLLSIKDQEGLTTTNSYLPQPPHFLGTIVDPRGKLAFKTQFDAQGRLSSSTDAVGNAVRNNYDPVTLTETNVDGTGFSTKTTFDNRGNAISVTDPLGVVRSLTYDASSNVLSATDPLGFKVTRVFDSRGNIVSMTDPLGNTNRVTFAADNQISTATDAMGHTGTLVYNEKGRLTQFVNAEGNSSFYKYDDKGRSTSFIDNLGAETKYEYASGPRPTKVIFADGKTNLFEYDPLNRITREVDEHGNETIYTYDATGRPLTTKDPLGGLTQIKYAGPNLERIINAAGGVSRFEYDDARRRTKEIDANGGVVLNQYNANNQLAKRTDPLGNAMQYAYRADGRVASVTDALGHVTLYGYDATGNRTSVTDANGRVWRYEYDGMGRVVKKIDALGAVESYDYDAVGNLRKQTNRNGGGNRYEYDSLGRLVRLIDAAGAVTSTQYDASGKIASVADPLGNTTRFTYGARGRLEVSVDAAGGRNTFAYDAGGNVISRTNELDQTTRFEYDAMNHLTKQIDPLGNVSSFTYDALGNTKTATDPLGRTSAFTVDARNQLLSTIDPAGNVTRFGYNAAGIRTTVTDPLGQVTNFQYDAANRLVSRTDPLGNVARMSYDAVGNLTQTIDRNGRTHAYVYDADNRLLREDWVGAGGGVIHSIASGYDADGNLTSASDSDSSYHYAYDANSRVTSVDNLGTPNLPRVILNYSFDAMGNRLSVSDNFGVKVNSTFDVRNLLSSESWSGPGINPVRVNFQYDATRQRTELNRYTDLAGTTSAGRTLQSFDAAGRLSRLSHINSAAGVLAEYVYAYDKASQLIGETVTGLTDQYTYDSAGQLKSADYSARDDEAFSYDAAGNRTTNGIVVGPNNHIQSDSQFAYAYDKEGNLVQKTNSATQAVTKYSYDFRNRLTAVEDFSSTGTSLAQVRYTYDVFDRRIATTFGGTTKYTGYDRDRVWADFDSSGLVLTRYLFGPNVDELIARQRPTEGIVWYLPDRLGSVRDLVNSAGAVVDHVDYNAFGAVVAETHPSVGDRFKYTGREYDSETGLYNYRARYYMPTLGIFMSEDPLGFCAGDANLRRYVANRPTGATDPSGMQAIADFGGLIASQIEVLTTLLEFGGDDPYSFRVGGKGGQIGAGLSGDFSLTGPLGGGIEGNLNLTDPSKSGPQLNIGDAVFNNGDEGIANKAGAKALSAAAKQGFEPDPKPTPFPAGEFQFFVESTAYKKSYFDHFLARFNVALYGGVAEELNLIAKYAVTDDASTLVQVRDQQGIWQAHAFATRTPTLPNQGKNPSPGGDNPPPPDGGFGFSGNGPSPGAGNPDDGDGDDGDGSSGGGGCCGGIFVARSYLPDAYSQVWAEPSTIRTSLQLESDNSCLHFANTYFVYQTVNRQKLNTNR